MTIVNPSIPLNPPREWFTPPESMSKDAGCIVEPNGRIYGYLCHWNAVLMDGSKDRWTPPRSKTGYAYAHTGDTVCADGSIIKTANLGGDAGHAKSDPYDIDRLNNLQLFYEDTTTQLARVVYGEDSNGVWFAGSVWPTVTDLEIAKLRASARSGHWAAIGDWKDISSGRAGYELVGACLVNVPGLKYARADRAASGILTMQPMTIRPGTDVETLANQIGELATMISEHFAVQTFDDLVVHDDRNAEWDSTAAEARVREWANATDAPNDQYAKAFFWHDGTAPELFGSYKLQFADVFDGELQAVPRGVFAVAAALQGARGGVEGISDSELEDIKAVVSKYYEKLANVFDDPSIVAPWKDEDMACKDKKKPKYERVASSGTIELGAAQTLDAGVHVSGVLVVEGKQTEDGRFIDEGAISWRDLPLPLYGKLENTEGHDAAELIGRINAIQRSEENPSVITYTATIFPDAAHGYGQRILDAVNQEMLSGVSIDGIGAPEDSYVDDHDVWHMSKLVIGGATLTPMPAISEASVTIDLTCGEDHMEDQVVTEDTTDVTPTDVAVEATDRLDALDEKVSALSDRVEYLIGLVESSQLSARLAALKAREAKQL